VKKIKRLLYASVLTLFICSGACKTAPAFAVTYSNAGLVGLWEYPSAEMPQDGAGRVYYNDFYPYRNWGSDIGLFPWFEFNVRLTEFERGRVISDGYGRYKDKAMDLKLLLLKQRGLIPSVAAGVVDMMGTEIRKAYFAAGTWRHENIALTVGYATDAYNGFFCGISYEPLDWLAFKAEYSPLDYEQDVASGVFLHPGPAKEKYNFGVALKSPWGIDGSLSYQRGEELCFSVGYEFDLTKPLFGRVKKASAPEPSGNDWESTDIDEMASSLQKELAKKGFGLRNVVVMAGNRKVHVAFENIGYSSQAEGTARVIILASHMIPWDTQLFSCSPMVRGNPVSRIEMGTEQLALVRMRKLEAYDMREASISWAPKTRYGTKPGEEWEAVAGPGASIENGRAEIRAEIAYEPRIDRTLDDAYMSRTDLDVIGRLRSSNGWEAYLKVRKPLVNDIDIWWQPEINDETRIWQGVLSYAYKADSNLWFLGEAGWIDRNYFGGNFWGRLYAKRSPFWAGARASVFKERDFNSFAGLADYRRDYYNGRAYYIPENGDNDWRAAYWAEGGYHDAEYDADITARYGKFADGDKGWRLDAVRSWDDTSVGFYFTDTDRKTSGKSYTDAGMILHIPLLPEDSGLPLASSWDEEFTLLSTFRLFAGVMPGAWMPPEKLLGQLRPDRLGQELPRLMEHLLDDIDAAQKPEDPHAKTHGIFDRIFGTPDYGDGGSAEN